jgi:hypothetical protein
MLGVILLACTALYAYARTAILGAILLTGYLGGLSPRIYASTVRSSPMSCSASISASWPGAGYGCAIQGCRPSSRFTRHEHAWCHWSQSSVSVSIWLG